MIYTPQQIKKNQLYGNVMKEINELHKLCHIPVEFNNEKRRTTTGNQCNPFWDAGSIGDWDGDEDEVAETAQNLLNEVYSGLGLGGNGGIMHYYRSSEWADFVELAEEIIDNYHNTNAYDNLCYMDI